MISCKRVKNNRTVRYGSLRVGDTFLFDNKPCMVADRNGHSFPMSIETGTFMARVTPESEVVPIECELTFTVR